MSDDDRKRQRSPDRRRGAPNPVDSSSSTSAVNSSPVRDVSDLAGGRPVADDNVLFSDPDEALEENIMEELMDFSGAEDNGDGDDDDGEDLFGDDLDRDYQANPLLDHYEVDSEVDEEVHDDIDIVTRRLVEAKLDRRDRDEGRLPRAFLDDDQPEGDMPMPRRHRRRKDGPDIIDLDLDDTAAEVPADIADIRGPLNEWVIMDGPRQAIKREFHHFLTSFVNEHGESVYGSLINQMCEANGESLSVSYTHLAEAKPSLAYYVANAPTEVLKIFDAVALEVTLSGFENYDQIKNEIHVRITGLPMSENLRDLRQSHLNTLIRVTGVVTRRTGVFPQLKYVKYDCVKCGAVLGPYYQDSTSEIRVGHCPSCQSRGPFNVNGEETIYRNYQRLTLQETPGSVPAGRLPRHKEVICLWDLVDHARPGEEVDITGIYRNNFDVSLNTRNGFPVFATVIEANNISKKDDNFASSRLTEEDQKAIRNLSKHPRIISRLLKSIAPSIYGHEDIKTALALAMFGGVFKNPNGKHRLRGDINVLILGDPGTAKSQFLKYVEKTACRAVYTTGQGASAVGLTASVHKDPVTREWTLEGGALVMADKGVCLIDEFDKMNDHDRTSIHEAMEQQSISISKAGIVTTLQARCAVIAAANPIGGKYNTQLSFTQNVASTDPILSRFDILCVVRDTADPIADESLAKFVIDSHIRSHPLHDTMDPSETPFTFEDGDTIPQDLLRKYITYAREKVLPKISSIDQEKLKRLYMDLRKESQITGGLSITVRYLESIIRMSEAFARMQLRDFVRQDDVDRAISVCIRSFIGSQRYAVKRQMERIFEKYMHNDGDYFELLNHVMGGIVSEHMQYHLLKESKVPNHIMIDVSELELRAGQVNIHNLQPYYDSELFKLKFKLDTAAKKIHYYAEV